jgi:hypothetical protein
METKRRQAQRQRDVATLEEAIARDRAKLHSSLESLETEDRGGEDPLLGKHSGKVYEVFRALWP